ncbi:MAG: hypothetical protein M9921_14540 [Fimbriimonadaceae bacterium]|nr:hypothetical protein [Chthonomonadaceae bacterium]MCO5298063.1 hypothetical protein [Fimbriimonadaceae bacterium]
MSDDPIHAVHPQLVMQIAAKDSIRRVWVAKLPSDGNRYQIFEAPTHALPEFREIRVAGLLCAETRAGRDRIAVLLEERGALLWREISITRARTIARRLACLNGGVVHLALFDEIDRVVWEPVALP